MKVIGGGGGWGAREWCMYVPKRGAWESEAVQEGGGKGRGYGKQGA